MDAATPLGLKMGKGMQLDEETSSIPDLAAGVEVRDGMVRPPRRASRARARLFFPRPKASLMRTRKIPRPAPPSPGRVLNPPPAFHPPFVRTPSPRLR